jgi:pectate lyase
MKTPHVEKALSLDLKMRAARFVVTAVVATLVASGCGSDADGGDMDAGTSADVGNSTGSRDARVRDDTGSIDPTPDSARPPSGSNDAGTVDAALPRPDSSTNNDAQTLDSLTPRSDSPIAPDAATVDATMPRPDSAAPIDAGTPRDVAADSAVVDAGVRQDAGVPPPVEGLVGWAAVAGLGVNTTTGGVGGPTVTATTLNELNTAASGANAQIVQVSGHITGSISIGSNKTIVGLAGAVLEGHVELSQSVNVIVKNLKIVGYNCTDSPNDCSAGADAVTVVHNAHHLWFDHCDISDGSDGNLDMTHAVDFATVSWTKFSYSGQRAGGHQFSNLIGHTDDNPEDEGHLKITFHHNWWAANVTERMPRVRYGQVHLFDNLFTSSGNSYCLRVAVKSSILSESNVFNGVSTPFDLATGELLTRGDLFLSTTGNQLGTGKSFTPPYAYTLQAATAVEASVKAGVGPR